MKWTAPLLAALASGLAGADVQEPSTKMIFKDNISLPGASGSLAGVGVRVKKIGPAAVKVYGLGVYVDERGAKSALAKYKGWEPCKLRKSEGFFKDVLAASFEKTFVLRMARNVGTEKMVSALAESVKPRLSGPLAPLTQFESILLDAVGKAGGANKGLQFGFACKPGSLCVSINGKAAGTVSSKALSSALQDVYLGAKAVSQGAKDSTADGIAKMLG